MSKLQELLSARAATPLARELIDTIVDINPLHQRFLQAAIENASEDEIAELGAYLHYCSSTGRDTEYFAECYMTIVEDTLREQIYFQKNKHYRHSSFSEVASSVYFDDQYMSRYMYGLAISSFIWPNHVEMTRYFKETLPANRQGNYLEVGPGHGYYTMTAMQLGKFERIMAVDISATSLQQTRDVISHFHPGQAERVQLLEMDFLQADSLEAGSFDALVMGEVLEHVEQPGLFLERLAYLAKDDAHIYVTTCINAPAIDHIYLWRTVEDLERLIVASGLSIKSQLYLPYEGTTLAESVERALAVNVAYVLEKS